MPIWDLGHQISYTYNILYLKNLSKFEMWKEKGPTFHPNVSGEPVSSAMVAGWFCEKSGWIGKVEDVKHVFFNNKKKDFNWKPFWGGGFSCWWIVKYVDFIQFDSSRAGYHMVLGFRLCVCCKVVAVWWMTNRQSFATLLHFIILLHWKSGLPFNAQALGRLSLQWRRN